jgi:hypothetical protein
VGGGPSPVFGILLALEHLSTNVDLVTEIFDQVLGVLRPRFGCHDTTGNLVGVTIGQVRPVG